MFPLDWKPRPSRAWRCASRCAHMRADSQQTGSDLVALRVHPRPFTGGAWSAGPSPRTLIWYPGPSRVCPPTCPAAPAAPAAAPAPLTGPVLRRLPTSRHGTGHMVCTPHVLSLLSPPAPFQVWPAIYGPSYIRSLAQHRARPMLRNGNESRKVSDLGSPCDRRAHGSFPKCDLKSEGRKSLSIVPSVI